MSRYEKEANKLTSLFYEIYGDKPIMLTSAGEVIKPDDLEDPRLFIMSLKSWLSNNSLYPNITPQNLVVNRNRFFFQKVLSDFESQLSEELNLPVKLTCSATTYEESFHKNVLKWAAQIPDAVIPKVDEAYISKMTYGSNPNVYRDKIIEFMNRTREILKSNCGLYDRFTGDGFIAYFNKYMCEQEGEDYYEMMLKSCREILEFSNPFFEEWVHQLRRIPETEIGLCIGVDSGKISFKDLDNQLFAIGDACVWATRMNSAGNKGVRK